MTVEESIKLRKASKHLNKVTITDNDLNKLIEAAQLAPSCFNNQPWRYTFVKDEDKLVELQEAYSRGNTWAHKASLVIAVYSREELDCIIKKRKYYLFDTGIATGFLMLKATEMGLIAHPIAGFKPLKVKKILSIPADMQVIALIILGVQDKSAEERIRPARLSADKFTITV